ncbi:MAG: phage integrase N-terminal SAM-like domain-containing protein, partial [Proteobacteria bacterium]|nr:phage integrase N-terminal SAM-like domain-containing protein [Pseudomonadota bacterium]
TLPTIETQGDIGVNIASFGRHLKAENLAYKTQKAYLEAATQLTAFLFEAGMPQDVANIRREHVESFITHILERRKASTANNRYRGLQAFFKWADEEGLLTNGSPMAKMRPPRVPEEPPDVLKEDELRRLLDACSGTTFDDRRDAAILRVFYATGARLAEVAGLRWNPEDEEENDVGLDDGVLRVLGKGRRWRFVAIGPKVVKSLDRFLRLAARLDLFEDCLGGLRLTLSQELKGFVDSGWSARFRTLGRKRFNRFRILLAEFCLPSVRVSKLLAVLRLELVLPSFCLSQQDFDDDRYLVTTFHNDFYDTTPSA